MTMLRKSRQFPNGDSFDSKNINPVYVQRPDTSKAIHTYAERFIKRNQIRRLILLRVISKSKLLLGRCNKRGPKFS